MRYTTLYSAILRSQKPPPDLPYDVYTVILDHLRGNRKALHALTLVNRAMHAEAQPRLYDSIDLDSSRKILALSKAVTEAANPLKVGGRVRTLNLSIDFDLKKDTFTRLVALMATFDGLTELRVKWSHVPQINTSMQPDPRDRADMLVCCPTASLKVFEWATMYTSEVMEFITRQFLLEELYVADGPMVSSRHKEFPPGSLPLLSHVVGDARWLALVAVGRPITSATVTRTSMTATMELMRVLSFSRGPCKRLSFPGQSALSGLYAGDVADVAQWLPGLQELGDCYLNDPFTMSPDVLVMSLASFTELQVLRVITNGDWNGHNFTLEHARRIHGSVPSLRKLTVIPQSMSLKETRVFMRQDKEILGGRVKLFEYAWKEIRKALSE
ncbi:hypothetical protein BKA62DRAFT_718226 [Auriculariales sp. MPI-PUGE-AT-0066]|nr:hypothetical protein BKA62DRAFT_718226 [Auriculariales sp. MPI-PUGE-AT-0066]